MVSVSSDNIMIFVDLDDTLFQTRRKNSLAMIPATESPNPLTVSYMSEEQKALLDMLKACDTCSIIPVTARDHEQYYRTYISRDSRVKYASVYFGADILYNNESDPVWKDHVLSSIRSSSTPIAELQAIAEQKLNTSTFLIHNVDDYYLVIKNRSKVDYEKSNIECFMMLTEWLPDDFHLYQNDNNISIVPRCIDKKNAVQYLIDKGKPTMTIGIGDSLSDWNFMDICHFKIIPQKSQINQAIKQSIGRKL
jgi:hydroxymethylpyrimidine pyrophosphatase-like HAD family hydrolase